MLELLEEVVFPALGGGTLLDAEDAAALSLPGLEAGGRIAYTTDSFVVRPLFFPGGDIGKLAVCGTVNDLSMRGARPLFLTLGLILEEGLAFKTLEKALVSVRRWAGEAVVSVVAGDTKVVEKGAADGMYMNTSGIGVIPPGRHVSIRGARPGDVLIVSGCVGDHEAAVLSRREAFDFRVEVESDCAPLNGLVEAMLEAAGGKGADTGRETPGGRAYSRDGEAAGLRSGRRENGRSSNKTEPPAEPSHDGACAVHALRDPTRGGLAASLKEMATASGVVFEVVEADVPVREEVRAFCEVLGLDPLLLANEGKLLAAVAEEAAPVVLAAMRAHPLGKNAAVIGRVLEGRAGEVSLLTPLGSNRLLRMPSGEHFPRIC